MKNILTILFALSAIFLFSCDGDKNSNDAIGNDTTVSDKPEEKYELKNTKDGELLLNKLLSSYGWRDTEKKFGNYNYFDMYKNTEGIFILDWHGNTYHVYSDGMWITAYVPKSLNDEFPIGDCYSIHFNGKDTFDISHIHMCAVDNDEGSETYVRNETKRKELVHRSHETSIIEGFLENIDAEWKSCDKEAGTFRKNCSHNSISKRKTGEFSDSPGFMYGMAMDSYVIDIMAVSEDLDDPSKIIFECSEKYSDLKFTTLTFSIIKGLRTANYVKDAEIEWFIHADDYEKLDEPKVPCDEEEEEY